MNISRASLLLLPPSSDIISFSFSAFPAFSGLPFVPFSLCLSLKLLSFSLPRSWNGHLYYSFFVVFLHCVSVALLVGAHLRHRSSIYLFSRSGFSPVTVLLCFLMALLIWFAFIVFLVLFPVSIPTCFDLVILYLFLAWLLRMHVNLHFCQGILFCCRIA